MLTTNTLPRRCRPGVAAISSPRTVVRPKLPLRSYSRPKGLFNFAHIENAPFSRPKRFKAKKLGSCQKMDVIKTKMPDYTETAYREAVSRLKYLLAESYTPRMSGKFGQDRSICRRSNARIHESAEDTDEISVRSDCSKGLLGNLSSRLNIPMTSAKHNLSVAPEFNSENCQFAPNELSAFIMRQEEYIEQLEQDSKYCKEELKNLLGKIREVVAENDAFHDKNKAKLLQALLQEYDGYEERRSTEKPSETEVQSITGKKMKFQDDLPNIMYESRISELEAQLTQAKIELKKAQEDNQSQGKRFSDQSGVSSSPETVVQLEQVMREKREINSKLEEALRNLQVAREREMEASAKAKRAVDSTQQAEIDKGQAESEIRRLKDELERQREKIRESTQEISRRLAEERHLVERRYSQQVEQLSADVATHWDAASKSHLESDKQRREIMDLKRELAQKQALIDDLKKELIAKTSSFQSELSQLNAERDAVEQEVATAKLAVERCERQARQEQNRWQTEINSYKQRLERADADVVHCRRENLRLSEQIASLEKEINMSKIQADSQISSATPRQDKDKDIASMIMDMETKHEEADDAGAVKSTTFPSKKKRTVKVDLKLKINPKKKSVVLTSAKAPLSPQKEMASIQSSVEYLSNKIQDSLENQKDIAGSSAPLDSQGIPNAEENYPDNFSNQQAIQNLQPADYDPQDGQNYHQYPAGENYPAEYSHETYEQYDPSLYDNQEAGLDPTDPMYADQQQYENYSGKDYDQGLESAEQQQQQYVDSSKPLPNDSAQSKK